MGIDIINFQKQSILAYNDLIKFFNKSNSDSNSNSIELNKENLAIKLRELHNNLAFLGGIIDPNTGKCLWEVNPELKIESVVWDEDE